MSDMSSLVETSTNFPNDIYSHMQQRIKKFPYIIILNLIVGVWYFYWRITYSLNVHALWLSIPLLLAELYIYIRITIFLVGLWQPNWQLTKIFWQKKEQIHIKRGQLVNRLKQIDNIATEITQAEQFLNSFQIQVQTKPEDIIKVLIWFEELRQSFIPTQAWLECQTVLGEAFDNAVCHAHKKMPEETPIQLKVEIFNHSMIMKIWDYGPGFDLEKYRQQKEKELVDRYAENGRGINIITKVADYFSYIRQDDKRNCLLIVKSFIPNTEQPQKYFNLLGYLYSFYQLMLLSNPQYNRIERYLDEEKKKLKDELEQKELEEKQIFYFYNIINFSIANKLLYLVTFIFFVSPLAYFYTENIPFKYYNFEFTLHFVPTLLLNLLTFFLISWGIDTKSKWHNQLGHLCYLILGKYNFDPSLIKLEANYYKYTHNDESIVSLKVKIILAILAGASMVWGGYQMIQDDFTQYSY